MDKPLVGAGGVGVCGADLGAALRYWRVIVPAVLSLIVSYNEMWVGWIYSAIDREDFKVLGKLSEYERPCSEMSTEIQSGCEKLYRIEHEKLFDDLSHGARVVSIGVGVVLGSSEWFCRTESGLKSIQQIGKGTGRATIREGLFLYQAGTVPLDVCRGEVVIVVLKDNVNSTGNIGWKSGSLVRGLPSYVASFKAVNDFFSSYIRAFLSLAGLLFLIMLEGLFAKRTHGVFWYRRAIAFLIIHFLASSSLIEFLFPYRIGISFPLLMAGGTGGCLFIFLGLLEVYRQKSLLLSLDGRSQRLIERLGPIFVFVFLFAVYGTLDHSVYPFVQWTIAILTLPVALLAFAPANVAFAICFNCDVLANRGILAGYPTNTATHFLFFSFLFDSFEWVLLNSALIQKIDESKSVDEVKKMLVRICDRFGIDRTSIAMFTRDFRFRVVRLVKGESRLLSDDIRVSHIVASVMTARSPVLRVQVGSQESQVLRGEAGFPEDLKKGAEFSVFPLIHSEKVLGTLNLTGYPRTSLGDPSQMVLFLGLVERLLPRMAESSYREDLSPNVDEQGLILSVESKFSTLLVKTHEAFSESLDSLAKGLDCKIITSRAIPEEDRLLTFTNHNYSNEDTKFLETHSPRLKDTLVTSPANVAFSRRKFVYVNDIQRMYSIYAEWFQSLLKRNETKSLLVAPVMHQGSSALPWGVIWIEFPNRLNRPESDLRDLAEFLSDSIHRQLLLLLDSESQRTIAHQLSSLVPGRVMESMRLGLSPREEEEGYLLNIDLSGSTKLASEIGDELFSKFIQSISGRLEIALSEFLFTSQIIIWDAFIFTRPSSIGELSRDEAHAILLAIDRAVVDANNLLSSKVTVHFRAVLHFGDTTRDWNSGQTRSWTITGAALAESCKLESRLKGRIRVLLMSDKCPNSSETRDASEGESVLSLAA